MGSVFMSTDVSNLLRLNYAFVSGGRSPTNAHIVTFPEYNEALITAEHHSSLMSYLVKLIMSEEFVTGFTIVIDRRQSNWSLVKELLHLIVEAFPGPLETVYLLQPNGFFQKFQRFMFEQSTKIDLQHKLIILNSTNELYQHLDQTQLTSNLGGTLYYDNSRWIDHRQLVEALLNSSKQIVEDLESACNRLMMTTKEKDFEETAGQLEMMVQSLTEEHEQLELRLDKISSEAEAEMKQMRNVDDLLLLSPSSAFHVKVVERLIIQLLDARSKYNKLYDERQNEIKRNLKLRQLEEENNKWCAVLDGHLLYLDNFVPSADSVDEIHRLKETLKQFDDRAKIEVLSSEDFYKNWKIYLGKEIDCEQSSCNEDEPSSSPEPSDDLISDDNRIEISCQRYREMISNHLNLLQLGLQLHLHIEEAELWLKEGTNMLSSYNSLQETSHVNKSVLETAVDDITNFLLSSKLHQLKNFDYNQVITFATKDVTENVINKLEKLTSLCEEKRHCLNELIIEIDCTTKELLRAASIISSASSTSTTVSTALVTSTSSSTISNATDDDVCHQNNIIPPDSVSKANCSSETSKINTLNIDKLYLSSKMNREFSDLQPVQLTGTIRRKRGHVIQELILTERIYTNELLSIIEGYLKQFDNPDLQNLIPENLKDKRDVLFGNIPEIYNFHAETFLKCLETCELTKVGKCFTDHKSKFEMYSLYCQNKMQAERLIEKFGNNPFFKECQKRLGHMLPLSSYILKPIQRITKYHLLLRELIKMTTNEEEKNDLSEAVESMRDVVRYVNNILHQLSITGFEGDLKEQGRLLMQGSLDVSIGRKKDKTTEVRIKSRRRHVFLYEKSLLFCKKKEDLQTNERENYVFKSCLKMDDIGLTEMPKSGDERRFDVWCQGRQDVWIIQAPNVETKEDWINEIKRVLFNQYRQKREVSRMSKLGQQERSGSADSIQSSSIC